MHQLAGSVPHRSLRNLARKYGPVMHLQLGEVSAIVISSSESAKEIMKTHDIAFADRPKLLAVEIMSYNGTNITFAPHGDYWRQLRKICTLELLSTRRVKSYRSIREEGVYDLVDYIRSSVNGLLPFNLTEKIFSFNNDTISQTALGMKCKDQVEFYSTVKVVIELVGGFGIHDVFPSLKFLHFVSKARSTLEKAHHVMDRILNDIIVQHQLKREMNKAQNDEHIQEDLVDVLLRIGESGALQFPITIDNIKAVILDILTAGTETSSTTLDWAMAEVMRNPRIMKKAQNEVRQSMIGKTKINEVDIEKLSYLKAVIKETLRMHPPGPLLLPREARENVKIFGYDIPEKTRVIVNAWAIMRDPEQWKEPDKFIPERFESNDSYVDMKGTDFRYIPFGAGRRICPGLTFAIASIELPLAALLYHFDWSLADGINPAELNMEETSGLTCRRKENLSLIAYHFDP
ncbi:premnaspirodiene oxygenase-like [Impatiens glandulifera]|uniref:premnaspirodiene oxygenase-like n=1 Tax=Impatiens glandulifera TaxID=253017 RepID=UPI001FB14CF1|nr:premnaspirodiene oxygenase-like [Impatiens glandulifera]